MILDMLTGSQTWNQSQARLNAIWVPTKAKTHAGLKECHLSIAAAQNRGQTQRIKGSKATALVGLDADLGEFWETRYDMPEGSVVKMAAFKQEADGFKKMANVYIRLREGAALRMMKFELPNEHGRSRYPFAYVTGHFDYITASEAEAYGVKTNPVFLKSFGKARFKLCFEDVIIEPETKEKKVIAAKEVTTGDGKKQEVMMFEKVRKIRKR